MFVGTKGDAEEDAEGIKRRSRAAGNTQMERRREEREEQKEAKVACNKQMER